MVADDRVDEAPDCDAAELADDESVEGELRPESTPPPGDVRVVSDSLWKKIGGLIIIQAKNFS